MYIPCIIFIFESIVFGLEFMPSSHRKNKKVIKVEWLKKNIKHSEILKWMPSFMHYPIATEQK